METDQQFQSSQRQPHKKSKQTGTKQKQGSLCKRWTFIINNYDETDINRLEQTAKDINQFAFFLAETRPFYWQHTDMVKGYDLVNDLAVVPNLLTFNFTQYQGLNAASGSHCEFTGILNAVRIPVKFPAGLLWDPSEMPGFSVGFPSLSPGEIPVEFPAGIMVRLHVGFAGIPPGIPVIFPGGIQADSNGIPAGISLESHLGSQLHFLWSGP